MQVKIIIGVLHCQEHSGVLDLATAGLSECDAEDLKGGSVDENVAMLFDFANNKGCEIKRGLRDSIYLNVAAEFCLLAKCLIFEKV